MLMSATQTATQTATPMRPAEVPVRTPGGRMYELIEELYPICRSITGEGLRRTLCAIGRRIPIETHSIPSGARAFDWTVPQEWNIRDAYVKDAAGRRVIDFQQSNLHVVSYSEPVRAKMTLEELRPRLHTLPERPDWIPYRTSYYRRDWGFCLRQRDLDALEQGLYEVVIDSDLRDGQLNYGECRIAGDSPEEVLVCAHICHPSLCNDNLSGIAVAVSLAEELLERRPRLTYRFVFLPVTIGAIVWLSRNSVERIRHGLVLASVGDRGPFTYKKSRRGDAEIDRVMAHVLKASKQPHRVIDFSPYGYDERQFCSPGFNLPVGRLSRTPHQEYPEYHTSADDLSLIAPEALQDSWEKCLAAFDILETNRRYTNLQPMCEPQLGKRGLYRAAGDGAKVNEMALLWTLNLSDGDHSLLDIAERSALSYEDIRTAAASLAGHDLLKPVEEAEA